MFSKFTPTRVKVRYLFVKLETKFIKEGNSKRYLQCPSGNWANSFWKLISFLSNSIRFLRSSRCGLRGDILISWIFLLKTDPLICSKRPDLLPLLLLTKYMQFKHIIQVVSGVATISWNLIEYFQHMPTLNVAFCKLAWNKDVFKEKCCWLIFILMFFACHSVLDSAPLKGYLQSQTWWTVISYSYRISDRQSLHLSTPWILHLKTHYC